ncbi:hypothetical protein O2064_004632 [Enterobacter hormaechei]|nr:hypothetical protein [Enterobacter hormaechei]
MAALWFIRVTRWWSMRMVCLLSVTLIQRNEQNAVERGESPEKPANWPV